MAPIPAPVAPPGAVPLGTLADWLLFGVCLFAVVCVIGAIGIHILRQFITPMPGKSDGPASSRHRHDAVADLGIVTLAQVASTCYLLASVRSWTPPERTSHEDHHRSARRVRRQPV